MANVQDLQKLETPKPRNYREWLHRFTEQEKQTVVEAILTHPNSRIYPVLSSLDENPYPFEPDTLNYLRRRLQGRQA